MSWLGEVASAFTAVGVLVASATLWAQLVQRREELAQRYDQRFWDIGDRCAEASQKVREDARYLELCEDQFDAIRLGWIRSSTWETWHAAISAWTLPKLPDEGEYPLRLLRTCVAKNGKHPGWDCPALVGVGWFRKHGLRLTGSRARRMIRSVSDLSATGNGTP